MLANPVLPARGLSRHRAVDAALAARAAPTGPVPVGRGPPRPAARGATIGAAVRCGGAIVRRVHPDRQPDHGRMIDTSAMRTSCTKCGQGPACLDQADEGRQVVI